MTKLRTVLMFAMLLWGCDFVCALPVGDIPEENDPHAHAPATHECKCGPDCQCDPCACGPFIYDGHEKIANYAHEPTTISVKDGAWFEETTWSAGVPDANDVFKVGHAVTIAFHGGSGDLNGDGELNVEDYKAWDGDPASIRLFLDDFFQLVVPNAGNATAQSGMIGKRGSLTISADCSLAIGTLHNLGALRQEPQSQLVFRDLPWDYVKDAMQWGHGLLNHSGSTRVARGATYRSENPAGVRGHIANLHSAYVDVEACAYEDMGRTTGEQVDNTQIKDGVTVHIGKNQMSRYPEHFHHCTGPKGLPEDQPQGRLVGNTFFRSKKWPITLHASSYMLVDRNLIDGAEGAGIAFETGDEYGNTVSFNTIRNVTGSGGVQSRGGGNEPRNVGDGTPANPYRTEGDMGFTGAGIWGRGVSSNIFGNTIEKCRIGVEFWARFAAARRIPTFKGAAPMLGEFLEVEPGQQFKFQFADNAVSDCGLIGSIQGLDTFTIKRLKGDGCANGIDFSYNGAVRMEDCELIGTGSGWPMQPGFTNRFEWINCTVKDWRGAVQIWNEGLIKGGEFDAVNVQYKHVGTVQRAIVIDGAKIDRLSYTLGDMNKNVDLTCTSDLLVYDFNGVPGDNFQVFFDEQADDFIPVNLADGNPRRVTPEPGLTNKQLEDKHGVRLGGKGIPAGAVRREGIVGWVAPIPDDLTPPKIVERMFTATATSITIRCKTDEPARIRTDYAIGDVPLGKWTPVVLPAADFATEHVVIISGLKPNTAYSIRQLARDAVGNQGGDTRSSGIKYTVQVARTAK
jgi:hypothetical protein